MGGGVPCQANNRTEPKWYVILEIDLKLEEVEIVLILEVVEIDLNLEQV